MTTSYYDQIGTIFPVGEGWFWDYNLKIEGVKVYCASRLEDGRNYHEVGIRHDDGREEIVGQVDDAPTPEMNAAIVALVNAAATQSDQH